jgi:hypothetical protein
MTKAELIEKLNVGTIRLSVPDDSTIRLGIGEMNISSFVAYTNKDEFLKLIDTTVLELTFGKSIVDICVERFKNYLLDDCEINFQALKEVHEMFPQNKTLFGYVDSKDPLHLLMTGQVSGYGIEKRSYMLMDYFEGEWDADQLK